MAISFSYHNNWKTRRSCSLSPFNFSKTHCGHSNIHPYLLISAQLVQTFFFHWYSIFKCDLVLPLLFSQWRSCLEHSRIVRFFIQILRNKMKVIHLKSMCAQNNAKESFGLHPNIKGQYRVLWISRASKVCTRVNDHRMNQGVFSHVSRLEYSSVPVCIQDSGGSRGGAQEDLLPPLSFGPKPRTAGPRHQLGCPLIFRSWSASDCTIRFGLLEQLGIRILLK